MGREQVSLVVHHHGMLLKMVVVSSCSPEHFLVEYKKGVFLCHAKSFFSLDHLLVTMQA